MYKKGIIMGKYANLNVLNNQKIEDEFSMDAIDQVAGMIKSSGKNRSQRRRLERSLGKMQTILEHSQKHLDRSAYEEYKKAVDMNYAHFFATLSMVMLEDYRWREDDTHDQISSLLERINKKLEKYAARNMTTQDILDLCEDKVGIQLIPDDKLR